MAIADWSLRAIKERWLARSIARRLLSASEDARRAQSTLTGRALYRAALVQSGLVAAAHVDEVLDLAEDSVDDWTAPRRKGLGLREVAHFVIMSEHQRNGNDGSVVSFGAIVNSLIPAEL